jgi:hypothetical protein|nr:MAG TPA: YjcQ protein [Caudoviricetes sp.]
MGKTDYYTIVAKILVYLYKKYKHMDIESDYISPMTKDFPIPEEQLKETVLMMVKQGFITGNIVRAWGGDVVLVEYPSLKITPAGIDYLQDNSKIRKICEVLKEAKAIWELFL